MLTCPIRLEPICGNVLFLRLQPIDNDPLHCMCKLYGRSLKEAIAILVELSEILLAEKKFRKARLRHAMAAKERHVTFIDSSQCERDLCNLAGAQFPKTAG